MLDVGCTYWQSTTTIVASEMIMLFVIVVLFMIMVLVTRVVLFKIVVLFKFMVHVHDGIFNDSCISHDNNVSFMNHE